MTDAVMWRGLELFCQYEKELGGPDPHMDTVGWIAQRVCSNDPEKVWAAGLYAGVYNVATAEMLLQNLRVTDVWKMSTQDVAGWLDDRWKGMAFRQERRAVKSPVKLARYLRDLAAFVYAEPWLDWEDYEEAWAEANAIYSMGRYSAMKFLEALRRYVEVETPAQTDMRPAGGWSPRECLALVWPGLAERLKPETADAWKLTNFLGAKVAEAFRLSPYEAQVLLCEFKQCAITRRQHPGHSLDSELKYAERVYPHWPTKPMQWKARSHLYTGKVLGEISGWTAADRKPLGNVYADDGIMWSDLRYDFHATKANNWFPVPWAA